MKLLSFLPLGWQIGIYLAVAAAVVGGVGTAVGAFVQHERRIGWDGALAEVAKQDAHAKAIATQAAQDVDDCERGGGSFDVSSGECGN